jgi:hypothetical protein
MRFEKVGVHYNRKFNLGNYESADISADMWASCEEGDDIGEVFDTLFAVAKETVKINVPPSYKKHTPDYTESFTKYGQKVDKSELIASIANDSELVDDDRLLDELTEVDNGKFK